MSWWVSTHTEAADATVNRLTSFKLWPWYRRLLEVPTHPNKLLLVCKALRGRRACDSTAPLLIPPTVIQVGITELEIAAMESIGTGPSSALDSTYGCLLIGCKANLSSSSSIRLSLKYVFILIVLFATFFQGLLTVQTFNYYENFPEDPLLIKMTVRKTFIVCSRFWKRSDIRLA